MSIIIYILAFIVYQIYLNIICRWQIKGLFNRPTQGPLIIMANHVSLLDPPIVGCIMNRRVYFIAKEELFNNPIANWLLRKLGAFSVKRGRPDLKAIRQAFNILKEGKVLGFFPEGTRCKQGCLGKAEPGAIMIALKSKVPILPVGIKFNKRRKVKVSIGKTFTLDGYYNHKLSKEETNEIGQMIMAKIKEELDKLD